MEPASTPEFIMSFLDAAGSLLQALQQYVQSPSSMGAFFGMAGATLLMLNHPRYSKWGWVAYLVSNGAWLIHASRTSQEPLMVQTVYFSFTSIVGAVVWIVRPALAKGLAAVPHQCHANRGWGRCRHAETAPQSTWPRAAAHWHKAGR